LSRMRRGGVGLGFGALLTRLLLTLLAVVMGSTGSALVYSLHAQATSRSDADTTSAHHNYDGSMQVPESPAESGTVLPPTMKRDERQGIAIEEAPRAAVAPGFAAEAGGSLADLYAGGRVAPEAELRGYAEREGWTLEQSATGPAKYVDENGVPRLTIKSGSSRTPGSEDPHIEVRDETGQRTDPYGNPVNRRSPDNHYPYEP